MSLFDENYTNLDNQKNISSWKWSNNSIPKLEHFGENGIPIYFDPDGISSQFYKSGFVKSPLFEIKDGLLSIKPEFQYLFNNKLFLYPSQSVKTLLTATSNNIGSIDNKYPILINTFSYTESKKVKLNRKISRYFGEDAIPENEYKIIFSGNDYLIGLNSSTIKNFAGIDIPKIESLASVDVFAFPEFPVSNVVINTEILGSVFIDQLRGLIFLENIDGLGEINVSYTVSPLLEYVEKDILFEDFINKETETVNGDFLLFSSEVCKDGADLI